jgi:hypothetical protein
MKEIREYRENLLDFLKEYHREEVSVLYLKFLNDTNNLS